MPFKAIERLLFAVLPAQVLRKRHAEDRWQGYSMVGFTAWTALVADLGRHPSNTDIETGNNISYKDTNVQIHASTCTAT